MAMDFLGACPEIAHRPSTIAQSQASLLLWGGQWPGCSNFPRIHSVQGSSRARVLRPGSSRREAFGSLACAGCIERGMAHRRTSPKITHAPFQSPFSRLAPAPPPKQAKPAACSANPETRWAPPSQLCREGPEKCRIECRIECSSAHPPFQFQFAGWCSDCPNISPFQFQHLRPRQQQLQRMHRKSLT
jgi:hypothetical protein